VEPPGQGVEVGLAKKPTWSGRIPLRPRIRYYSRLSRYGTIGAAPSKTGSHGGRGQQWGLGRLAPGRGIDDVSPTERPSASDINRYSGTGAGIGARRVVSGPGYTRSHPVLGRFAMDESGDAQAAALADTHPRVRRWRRPRRGRPGTCRSPSRPRCRGPGARTSSLRAGRATRPAVTRAATSTRGSRPTGSTTARAFSLTSGLPPRPQRCQRRSRRLAPRHRQPVTGGQSNSHHQPRSASVSLHQAPRRPGRWLPARKTPW